MYQCPYCNSQKYVKSIKILSNVLNKHVNYYKCSKCGSIHQFPLPDKKSLIKYYESYAKIKKKLNPGYLENKNLDIFIKERGLTLKEINFDIKQFKNKNNVELGCANGFFLKYLKNKGVKNITGIDISKSLLESIKIKNIKLYNGDLSKLKDKSVDVLYLFNIMEHISDQNILINQVKAVMKNNSYLIIEIPLSGIISSLFNKQWRFLMPDEHLHIPTKKALISFFNKNGFKLSGYTRFGSGFTSGSINKYIKYIADKLVKLLKIGDRGTFLFYIDNC